MTEPIREILTQALSLWWLRPENGLAVASYCLRGADLAPKRGEQSADYACGDGVNTFLKTGGRFDLSFDLFGRSVSGATMREIVDKKIDVFDHSDEEYRPIVRTQPTCRYTYGTDHKSALLEKARKLALYDNLLEADLRDDADIPDGSLDLAYCNSLYWVAEVCDAFGHIVRKVKPGGRLVFDVMTGRCGLLDYDLLLPAMPESWRALLDRGRQETYRGMRSEADWDRVFLGGSATDLVEKRDIFPTAIASIWNVGLRPIFPVLNRMAQAIDEERRLDIKQEWVETFADLFEPVLREPQNIVPAGPAIRLQYVMTKR